LLRFETMGRSTLPPVAPSAESPAQLEQLARLVPGVFCDFRIGPDGRATIPYATPGLESIYGSSLEVLSVDADPALSVIHPDDVARVSETIEASARDLTPWRCDYRVMHPERGEIWIEARSIPTHEADGGTLWRGFLLDITERKRTEIALREREIELEKAQRLGRVGHWQFDLATGTGTWSAQLLRLHGRDQVRPERSFDDALEDIHPADRARVGEVLHEVMAEGVSRSLDYRLVVRGRERWLHGLFELERGEDGRPRVLRGTAQDITHQKRLERYRSLEVVLGEVIASADSLLSAATRLFESLAEAIGAAEGALWMPDDGLGLVGRALAGSQARSPREQEDERRSPPAWVSRAWETKEPIRWELPRDEASSDHREGVAIALAIPIAHGGVGHAVLELCCAPAELDDLLRHLLDVIGDRLGQLAARHQEQREARRLLALSPNLIYSLQREGQGITVRWLAGDVERLTGFAPGQLTMSEDWLGRMIDGDRERVIASHATLEDAGAGSDVIEYRWRHRDGRLLWLRDEKRLAFDDRGRATGEIIGVLSDVTKRVELEEQLRQSQKMEAVGLLAGGVAHDFNNLLTVIQSDATLLGRDVSGRGEEVELVQDIIEAAERAAALTRQLLLFSRRETGVHPETLDPNAIIAGVERMVRRSIGEDVLFRAELAPLAHHTRIDRGQLEQLIVNLAVNARDAMPRGGELTIRTRGVVLDEAFCARHPDASSGPHVVVSVSDTGVGMTADIASRIFEPFFTTKGRGRGTGLGLAIVFGIVRSVGGFIDVASTPGTGTTFDIYLPGVAPRPEASGPASRSATMGAGELILLVEDEALVRRAMKRSLSRCGYRVVAPEDPADALAELERCQGEIALMITDVVMPETSGPELAEKARLLWPDLPILYVSGYVDDAVQRHGFAQPDASFLQKPVSPDVLAERVRSLLKGRS